MTSADHGEIGMTPSATNETAASAEGAIPTSDAHGTSTQTVDTERFRTLFISDVHLGTTTCQADELLAFLARVDADTIFLVGDIVDFWRIKRRANWPQSHSAVLQAFLAKARSGTRLIMIPGNHDDALRVYCGQTFGPVTLKLNDIHETADGRQILIMHGDEFDVVVRHARWLAYLGDSAYRAAMWFNARLSGVRRSAGVGYWSLSKYLKHKVKQAVNFIGEFEGMQAREARKHGADGVICGHIHHASLRQIDSILYVNTGDWVESCTAVAETWEGELRVIRWLDRKQDVERGASNDPPVSLVAGEPLDALA